MATANLVYFHGQPGSPEELRLLHPDGWKDDARLFAPNWARDQAHLPLGPYLDHLAATILKRFPQGPIRLVGFSLGGFAALEIALRLTALAPERNLSIDLVSTPAPLGDGALLADMAGGMVFSLARKSPAAFGALTQVQGLLSRYAPEVLLDQLFATAASADRELARNPAFRASLKSILANSLQGGAPGYRREILGYVQSDGAGLAHLDRPVRLWQGLADTWTPPAMASLLADRLPEAKLTTFENHAHYSTLIAAVPEIFKDMV